MFTMPNEVIFIMSDLKYKSIAELKRAAIAARKELSKLEERSKNTSLSNSLNGKIGGLREKLRWIDNYLTAKTIQSFTDNEIKKALLLGRTDFNQETNQLTINDEYLLEKASLEDSQSSQDLVMYSVYCDLPPSDVSPSEFHAYDFNSICEYLIDKTRK